MWKLQPYVVLFLFFAAQQVGSKKGKETLKDVVMDVDDLKEFKKLLRTRTNVLAMFAKNGDEMADMMPIFSEVATIMKGKATLVAIDCSDAGKLCKKLKVSPRTVLLKHYKDGDFNKDYDRKKTVKSLTRFLENPLGDTPWEEEDGAEDVRHINTDGEFRKMLRKEKKPILMMFYAPWCGVCKALKPEYSAAATELKGKAILAGMDVTTMAGRDVIYEFNITGYPTIVYFEKGTKKFDYGGGRKKDEIIKWMNNPEAPQPKEEEPSWSDEENDVVHLTEETFGDALAGTSSLLVMFYAPWCGHCKKMKPEYERAAATLIVEEVPGALAAVDATKERELATRYNITGFPSVKYFKEGKYVWDFHDRTADNIVEFMKDPKEPPPPPPPEASWSDVPSKVHHLDGESFRGFTKKKKHTLVMFYAPWCGHCKAAKPKFQDAAEQMADKKKVAFAAVDCTTTVNQELCSQEEVQGYPTIKYYNYGKKGERYTGGRETDAFVQFMENPDEQPTLPPPEPEWSDEPSAVEHLTDMSFDEFLGDHSSVLVMFYAPWCGHCKAMKPAFTAAANQMSDDKKPGVMAAVDCTKERGLADKFEIKGFPTVKYFKDGKFAFDYSGSRTDDALVQFMDNPVEPTVPPPEPKWSDQENQVEHLTGDSFNAFVEKTEHVLVMFYAPCKTILLSVCLFSWILTRLGCGHCKKAKPEFETAAETLSGHEGQALAAIDCTEYSDICGHYGVKGYPTFKYFHNGEESEKYEGGRKADDFSSFVSNKVTADKKDEL